MPQQHNHNTRKRKKIYASANFVNYPMHSTTPDEIAISPWGQDLRKANCKIVGGKYPYIIPTTTNGIIPPGHEWLASYSNCMHFKSEQIHIIDLQDNIESLYDLRYQNLLGDPFHLARDNDITRIGILQQNEARATCMEGQDFALRSIASDVRMKYDIIPAFPYELLQKNVIQDWRKKNPFTRSMYDKAALLNDCIDYKLLRFYKNDFLLPYAVDSSDTDLFQSNT